MPRRVDRLSRLVAQTSTTLINNLMHARIAAAHAAGQRVISIELELDRHVGLWDTVGHALPVRGRPARRAGAACRDIRRRCSTQALPRPCHARAAGLCHFDLSERRHHARTP